ncbi:hypothetical protein LCD44_20680 [Enterobacter asburiae]|uniref:hypothetical protein n=1 Tax=Enterobacter asburiae TaxID=61645 RepID=UPI001FF3D584|nr:hypothetical protein [Enterobacter asburiae]UOY60921.1 hypothetical protein LCD44_20680 [Enterobacter asburiae]
MYRYIEVNSVREGVYLLWRLGHAEDARRFAFSSQKNRQQIQEKINGIIDGEIQNNDGDSRILRAVLRYASNYRERSVDESQLSWLRRDAYGCLYFWLGLVKEYVTFWMTESNEVNSRYYYRRKGHFWLTGEHMSASVPDTPEQCYLAILSILDMLPHRIKRKDAIIAELRDEYFYNKERFRKDFSWMADAEPENIEWIMEQFSQHRKILRDFKNINLVHEMQNLAVPALYYLWEEEPDTKQLFLNTLRKRYANMKHRKKVAVKSPVNIRISENAKKTLVKLEKRFNRNRADVIEYLIEKTWQELNQKN